MFPPRTSTRPFLLELLAVGLTLTGALLTLKALIAIFKALVWGTAPASGLWTSEILIEAVLGLAALAVSYALWKEHPWGRPVLVAFLLTLVGREWLSSPRAATLAGTILSFTFILWYFYLWPNTVGYYRRLRQAGDSGR